MKDETKNIDLEKENKSILSEMGIELEPPKDKKKPPAPQPSFQEEIRPAKDKAGQPKKKLTAKDKKKRTEASLKLIARLTRMGIMTAGDWGLPYLVKFSAEMLGDEASDTYYQTAKMVVKQEAPKEEVETLEEWLVEVWRPYLDEEGNLPAWAMAGLTLGQIYFAKFQAFQELLKNQ